VCVCVCVCVCARVCARARVCVHTDNGSYQCTFIHSSSSARHKTKKNITTINTASPTPLAHPPRSPSSELRKTRSQPTRHHWAHSPAPLVLVNPHRDQRGHVDVDAASELPQSNARHSSFVIDAQKMHCSVRQDDVHVETSVNKQLDQLHACSESPCGRVRAAQCVRACTVLCVYECGCANSSAAQQNVRCVRR
jgi:hypothetical protein